MARTLYMADQTKLKTIQRKLTILMSRRKGMPFQSNQENYVSCTPSNVSPSEGTSYLDPDISLGHVDSIILPVSRKQNCFPLGHESAHIVSLLRGRALRCEMRDAYGPCNGLDSTNLIPRDEIDSNNETRKLSDNVGCFISNTGRSP